MIKRHFPNVTLGVFVLLFALSGAVHLNAQSSRWEWGIQGFGASYLGDLVYSRYPTSQAIDPGAGLFLRRNLSSAWSARLQGSYLRIHGNDAYFSERAGVRDISFESQVGEAALLFEYDLRGKRRYQKGHWRRTVSPFVYGGGGYALLMPETNYGTIFLAGIDADKQVETPVWAPVIPLGGGFRFDLGRKTTISLELGLRALLSDFADGVAESGDPDDNDWYVTAGIGVSRRFGWYKDGDGDRVLDRFDACPQMPGEITLDGCPDTDGDGIIDQADSCPYQRGSSTMNGCPDKDGDRVADKDDRCPDVAGLVYFAGCPDADKDSVPDVDDLCPELAGLVYAKGCPDADRDSIPDDLDACPREAGLAVNKGCPDRDKDNDGVVDRLDKCPDKAGIRVLDGCPDTDGDGIIDEKDSCPTLSGTIALNGCPDTDGDGIADKDDKCPGNAGPASNKGCPEITKEEQAALDRALRGVQFDVGKSVIRKVSYPILDEVVKVMKKQTNYILEINGHTDSDGNDEKNRLLSDARAKACMDYLISKGIDKKRLRAQGFGETQPIAPNNSKSNKSLNRRVEFKMILE